MEDMGQEEKDRVAEQQKKLGEEGLKKKAVVLEAATEENEVWFYSYLLNNKQPLPR